jgi:signal transduction histidine kinase
MSSLASVYERYRELQAYVGWEPADAERVRAARPLVENSFPALIDDFYAEIDRHPDARRVITGGEEQIARLKQSLRHWLAELFSGQYDEAYVERRWRVGYRHVEIGLAQVFTNAALSRLRRRLLSELERVWTGEPQELLAVRGSLSTLIDLDLAIIEDAYQAEHLLRQQRIERLATLGQVAGGIAHELRNPLNVVKTSVYYLLHARQASADKLAEHLQRIDRQVSLADAVITSLSSFARMPLPELLPVVLEDCLRDALEHDPVPGNIALEWDVPGELPPVLADADQMRIVFGNLLRNARDAMPQGGRLVVRARAEDRHVDVSIADSGPGIKTEDLKRILEPLYSTKARGLGLGLAITRAILEKHGARLDVASQPGRGATFTVSLPIDGSSHPTQP